MNSPGEPISPSPSTPSSGSPPNEEVTFQGTSTAPDKGFVASLTSQLSSTFGGSNPTGAGGSSKRRLPAGGSFGTSSSSRDLKSRRRENSGRMPTAEWEKGLAGKREKDEFLDQGYVDYLRKEIGDPFQENRM